MNGLVVVTTILLAITMAPYAAYGGLYLWLRPSGSPAAKRDAEPFVSLVLPTFNEAGIVERKLNDLCELDYPMAKLEVVVVDSSDDRTPELVRSFFSERDSPELTFIKEEERRGLAVALNEAYAAAKHEVVVKTDCDSLVAPDALHEAVRNLADPDVGAVTGRNDEVLSGSAVEAGYRGVQTYVQLLESHLDSTLIFHGPFSAFRKDDIVEIDHDSIADDTELALKIRKNGNRVLFDPAIRYKEAAHSGFRKRRRQKDRRAMGLLRLLWRERGLLGGYGRYGQVVLPFNWWFMTISPWLLALATLSVVGAAFSVSTIIGLVILLAGVTFVWLGGRDALGPVQSIYAILDTQISLSRAMVKLVVGQSDGTWEIDDELRENIH